MPTPMNVLTIEQAHKEFKSLVDYILAKFQQLDASEFEVVGTPAFNAKSVKLPRLFAHMNQLYQRLNLAMSTYLHRLPFFKH